MRRLPDGTLTEDINDYLEAWQTLGRPIEEATGFYLYGFDPTLSFSNGPLNVQLPVGFVEKMNEALEGDK